MRTTGERGGQQQQSFLGVESQQLTGCRGVDGVGDVFDKGEGQYMNSWALSVSAVATPCYAGAKERHTGTAH